MVERISAEQFHGATGIDDWRVLSRGATAYFATNSFARGVELVEEIARLAEGANHHPDIDLRYRGVTVRLSTHEVNGLSERGVELARAISLAARSLDIAADPTAVQDVRITIDARNIETVRSFWHALLGYRNEGDEDLLDPLGRGPAIWFQRTEMPRTERNRVRVDVFVPHDTVERRVEAAISVGGRLVNDEHAPSWWVLVDPEGNEACVASWMLRD